MEVLTQRQQEELSALFGDVLDPNVAQYLDEAKRCVEVNACRSAIVIAWCGIIHHLHRQVEITGFDSYPGKKIKGMADLQKIMDADLLQALYTMGLLKAQEELKTLDDLRRLRNDCAHAKPLSLKPEDVLYRFKQMTPFVSQEQGVAHEYRSYLFVADCIKNLDYDLPTSRARGLIQGIRQKEMLPFVDRLVRIYFSQGNTEEHRRRIRLVWGELHLDEQTQIRVNRKIADRLVCTPSLDQIQARQLVFWSQLKNGKEAPRRDIITNLLPEFQGVVANGLTNQEDVDMLCMMRDCAVDDKTRTECEGLLERMINQVFDKED